MNLKPVVACSPLLLGLVSGAARAELEPFSFGAGETIEHHSNLNHSEDAARVEDWFSTTELRAAMDQAIGRQRLTASAGVNYTGYRHSDQRDTFGYRGAAALEWSTIGDLSGSLGADTSSHQYVYGLQGELASSNNKNLEKDNHLFAKVALGGPSRWRIFAGFDAIERHYSDPNFATNEERQWQQSLGTTYSTSPDLSFGVTGVYTHGEFPNYRSANFDIVGSKFTTKSFSGTTHWQASGESGLDASLGLTDSKSDFQPAVQFLNGSLNWTWTPPSRFRVGLGMSRGQDGGAAATDPNALTARSINTSFNLNVHYELTGKTSLVATTQYMKRKYADALIPVISNEATVPPPPPTFERVNGSSNTWRLSLMAHYLPTRTTDLSCGGAHEVRTADSKEVVSVTPNYTDTSLVCTASISFN